MLFKKQSGFTLIELLVVVLIIGILTAIALPQYEFTVEKVRAMRAVVAARALKDAQEIYYMANGSYADDLADLDIQVPDVEGFTLQTDRLGKGRISYYHSKGSYYIVAACKHRTDIGIVLRDMLYCCPRTERGRKVCQIVGSAQVPSNSHCSNGRQIF